MCLESFRCTLLVLSLSTLQAQFPKAYMADAIAAPTVVPPGEGDDARKLLLLEPEVLAIDAQNNIYVSDSKFNRITRITPTGRFAAYAGTGVYGSFRANGPATQSGLAGPLGMALDRNGNLFIANRYASQIVRVNPDGIISTYAGGGTNVGDGFAPLQTRLSTVELLAVDAQGNVYFYEFRSFKIRKIPSGGGAIETFAGTGTEGDSELSGPAKSIPIGFPTSLFVGADNNLYLVDAGGSVRRITPDGTSTFILSTYNMPMKTKPSGWTISELGGGYLDSQGTLWLSSYLRQQSVSILRCPQSKDCEVVAGGGDSGYNGDGTPATQKKLSVPGNMVKDSLGNLIFIDRQRIRSLSPSGELKTIAGGDTAAVRGDGQKNARVILESSSGIAVDSQNNVYASDERNHIVWRFGADGNARIIAGTGTPGYSGDNGPGNTAELNLPGQLALDAARNLYILDTNNYVIRKVTPQGQITTVAGRQHAITYSCPTAQSTTASQWCFTIPASFTVDSQGNLWVGDFNKVVKVSGGSITTLSPAIRAAALALDRDGNLLAAAGSSSGTQIFRSTAGTGVFTVMAGTGKYASTGDGGLATAADFTATAIAVDANSNILLADTTGRSLRAITPNGRIQKIACGGTTTGIRVNGSPSTDMRIGGGQIATGSGGMIYLANPGFSSDIFDDVHAWRLEPAQIFRSAVLNAASFKGGAVAGGEIVTIFGLDIGPKALATYEVVNGRFRDEIAQTRILFDGIRAPIIYVSETAASVVVPYGVAGKTETELWIEYQGVATNRLKMPVVTTMPGIFTIPPTGTGQAAVLHWPDYTVNQSSNALARDGVGMIFLTAGGEQGQDGMMAQTVGSLPFPVLVRVGNVEAQVLYAGPAPSLIYGMLQINFVVPSTVTPGDKVPLIVRFGETWSQTGLTINVK
jgi:uncharacterized protein (TIGR03437 family)